MTKFLLTMKLAKQGSIKGSNTKKEGNLDFSKGMECHSFSYAVAAPLDPNSGAVVGKRTHKPIVIRREVDSASPKLLMAFQTDEAFETAELLFSGTGPGGKPTMPHTIKLTNGVISDIKNAMGPGGTRLHDVTLEFESLSVDGIANGFIPWSLYQK